MSKAVYDHSYYLNLTILMNCLIIPQIYIDNHYKKLRFSIKNFFNKCDLRIWSHLLNKSLMENFIFLCSDGFDIICARENYSNRICKNWNVHPKIYLNGSLITQWRQIQTKCSRALIWTLKYLLSVLKLKIYIHKKLVRVTIDRKLNFHDHVSNLCKKVQK